MRAVAAHSRAKVPVLALASVLFATPVLAQVRDEPGPRRASFTTGASFGDGGTALALRAALGFPLAGRLGLDIGLVYARRLDFTLELCPPPRVCVLGGQLPVTGRTVSLLPELTIDLLPRSRRVRAYAHGGVGAGHVRQRYWFGRPPAGKGEAVEFTRSSLTVAVSYGGAVTANLSRRFDVGADVGWLRLFDEPANLDRFINPSGTLSTVRLGSVVSWRF